MSLMGAYMQNRCTLVQNTGRNLFGTPTGATETEISCRVEFGTRLVRNLDGQQVVSSVRLFIHDLHNLKHTDTIRLTEENTQRFPLTFPVVWSRARAIIAISPQRDFQNRHLEVSLA